MNKPAKFVDLIAKHSVDINMIAFITSELFIITKSKQALTMTAICSIAAIVVFICKMINFEVMKRNDSTVGLIRKILSSTIFPVGMCLIWYVLYVARFR